jgi:hypothetical protein
MTSRGAELVKLRSWEPDLRMEPMDPSNEFTLGFLGLSLTAKGSVAFWLVPGVWMVMAALPCWVAAMIWKQLKR